MPIMPELVSLQCSGLDQSSIIIRKIAHQVCVSLPSRKNVGVERKQRTTGECVGLHCVCVCVQWCTGYDFTSKHVRSVSAPDFSIGP